MQIILKTKKKNQDQQEISTIFFVLFFHRSHPTKNNKIFGRNFTLSSILDHLNISKFTGKSCYEIYFFFFLINFGDSILFEKLYENKPKHMMKRVNSLFETILWRPLWIENCVPWIGTNFLKGNKIVLLEYINEPPRFFKKNL